MDRGRVSKARHGKDKKRLTPAGDIKAALGSTSKESLHELLYGDRVNRFDSSWLATAPSALLR